MWRASCIRTTRLLNKSLRQDIRALSTGTPFLLTDIGEGISEVEILRFFVKKGDAVKQFQPLVEVQSDKATVEISSRYDGVIQKLAYEPGDIAAVGAPLCFIKTGDATDTNEVVETTAVTEPDANTSGSAAEQSDSTASDSTSEVLNSGPVLATPAVRALARELGVELEQLNGSGKNGRVTREDVMRHHGTRVQPEPDINTVREHETRSEDVTPNTNTLPRPEPIRGLTRGMFKSMTVSASIPQLGLSDDINMEQAAVVKDQLNSSGGSTKITYMPLFVKAASIALSSFPILNASIDEADEQIVYHDAHNISIAMATERGLIVPNIKNVESLSLQQIAEELHRLQDIAKSGKVGTDELTGGTFTISNIGSIGGTSASPVVFAPQVAIGAVGAIQKRPLADKNGDVSVSRMVTVSWAADHRIVDGATLALFNLEWKNLIENPGTMLLHVR